MNPTCISRALAALLLCVPLLGGCVATPPTTPQVSQIDSKTLGLSADTAPVAQAQWWKQFRDPQIDRLADLVLAGNPTLQGALARLRAAQSELAAGQAADYPQISLDGQEQRLLFSKTYIIPPPYAGNYSWMGQLEATLNWNIDFWGKQAALIDKARGTADALALDAAAAKLALSGAMAQTYVNLMLAYQEGDVADQTVAEREHIVALTQSRFNAGLENASSLEQAKALLSLAKIDQARFAVQREVEVHALAALAGQGAALYPTIVRPQPQLEHALALPDALPADLLARRPDILAARARIDAALAGRKAAEADFYPNINLAAFVGFQSLGLSNLLTGDSFTYGAGPALHLPLFDAGKLKAQYAGATAGVDIAVADYNGAVVAAIRQTADALSQVKGLKVQRAEQQQALDSAARAFKLAQERYISGLSGQIPMLTAESTLLQARQQAAGLAASDLAQRITLLLAAGGAFDPQTQIAQQDANHE